MKVAIIGAGAFGTALGGIIAENGYDVDYYDPKLNHNKISDTLIDANYILLCIPSDKLAHILPYLLKKVPLIVATKGLLSEKLFLDFDDFSIISGPGFANDIKSAKPVKFTITDMRLSKIFAADHVTFDNTDDKLGVLMCGALKNVYAIIAGLKDLQSGTSEHKKYVNDVVKEMKEILFINGARQTTVELACGRDDLIMTCNYPSRNYQFGKKISKNPKYKSEDTIEGLTTLNRIKHNEIVIPDNAKILKDLIARSDEWG